MLTFRPIALDDREAIHNYFYKATDHGSEYSFANLMAWGDQRVCFIDGEPLILSRFGTWHAYLFPLNRAHVALLRDDAHERGIKLRFWGLTAQEAACMDERDYTVSPMRNSFDYVYEIERLCTLQGKKLQAKRNHCNRFTAENPTWRTEPLTRERIGECQDFAARWFALHEAATGQTYEDEKRALARVFEHFAPLCAEGMILYTGEQMVAFSIGNRIRNDMFDVNFEKALADVHGAYPTINRAFACHVHQTYPEVRLLNREDDMGIEGLRKAKESYYPDLLLEKYLAEEIE